MGDFILDEITWNKDDVNIKTLATKKSEIVNALIKFAKEPIKKLSKEKIRKLKKYIPDKKELLQTCLWKKELCKIINWMYEIVTETIKVMEHIWAFYPEAHVEEKEKWNFAGV